MREKKKEEKGPGKGRGKTREFFYPGFYVSPGVCSLVPGHSKPFYGTRGRNPDIMRV